MRYYQAKLSLSAGKKLCRRAASRYSILLHRVPETENNFDSLISKTAVIDILLQALEALVLHRRYIAPTIPMSFLFLNSLGDHVNYCSLSARIYFQEREILSIEKSA